MKDYNFYVYILTNWNDEVMYIGMTNNLERRLYEHKNKLVDGFTKKYNVNKLVYYEHGNDVHAAIAREKEIKKWRREKKNNLVKTMNPEWKATGLDRFADLGGELVKEYTVYFHPLNKDVAIPLAKEYLMNARVANSNLDELRPFDSDALVEALIKTGGVPGKFLNLLYLAIEKAIQENWEKIDSKKIQDIGLSNYPEEPPAQDPAKPLSNPDINLMQGEE